MEYKIDNNPRIIDLSLWKKNATVFHYFRQYLCDKNNGELNYKVSPKNTVYYNNSSLYKSRKYIGFLNHVKIDRNEKSFCT